MSTDSPRGVVHFWEDFLYDVVADKPEYSVDTDPAVQIVATGEDGVVRTTMEAGQANIGGMSFGQLQWTVGEGYLFFEIRCLLSAIGAAAERIFVGFTDVQEDTLTEFPFTISGVTITPVASPDDVIGFLWDGAATNLSWYPASQNTDALVINGTANVAAADRTPPVAGVYQTLRMEIFDDAKVVVFSIDGKQIYRYSGTAAIADVALTPYFVVTEGTTAINFDVDYVEVEKTRA